MAPWVQYGSVADTDDEKELLLARTTHVVDTSSFRAEASQLWLLAWPLFFQTLVRAG